MRIIKKSIAIKVAFVFIEPGSSSGIGSGTSGLFILHFTCNIRLLLKCNFNFKGMMVSFIKGDGSLSKVYLEPVAQPRGAGGAKGAEAPLPPRTWEKNESNKKVLTSYIN